MSKGHKVIGRGQRCPLCGKPDWCAWLAVEEGRLLRCERTDFTSRPDIIVSSVTGERFYKATMANDKFPYYADEETHNRMVDKYRAKKSGEPVTAYTYTPRQFTIIDVDECRPNSELNEIYRYLVSLLTLDEIHREYLHKEGWTDELIDANHIVSMPIPDRARANGNWGYKSHCPFRSTICQKMVERFGDLYHVPPFFLNGDKWDIEIPSGILFPLYDEKKNLYRLRVRMDFLNRIKTKDDFGRYTSFVDNTYVEPLKGVYKVVDGKKVYDKGAGKYRNLSSFVLDEEQEKNGLIRSKKKAGTSSGNHYGLYSQAQDGFFCCYVTEGEKKAIYGNAKMKAPFISLPGVNSFSLIARDGLLDYLKEQGCHVIIVAFDADKAVNDNVLRCQQQTVSMLKEHGFMVGLAEWDETLGKGIDDLLAGGHNPKFVQAQ